jgi:hypothetical protein
MVALKSINLVRVGTVVHKNIFGRPPVFAWLNLVLLCFAKITPINVSNHDFNPEFYLLLKQTSLSHTHTQTPQLIVERRSKTQHTQTPKKIATAGNTKVIFSSAHERLSPI